MHSYMFRCLVSSSQEMLALQSSGQKLCWQLFSSSYYGSAITPMY